MTRIFLVLLFSALNATFAQGACPSGQMSTGWCWPTNASGWTVQYLDWHQPNSGFNGVHLAKDIAANENDPVYSVDYGIVLIARDDINFYGGASGCSPTAASIKGAGLVIRHYTVSGKAVDVLYAHLKNLQVKRGDVVTPGSIVGQIRNYAWCGQRMDHLHLGVANPARNLVAYEGGGNGDVWAGYGSSDRGFVDPVDFFGSTSKGGRIYSCDPSKERCLFRINGPVAWYPPVSDCQQASQWFNMTVVNGEKVTAGSATKSACPLACYSN